MHIIYRAANLSEAHIVAGLLQSHDLQVHVGGHYLQGGVGDLAPSESSTVYVAEQDMAAARTLVDEYCATSATAASSQTVDKPSQAWRGIFVLAVFLGVLIVSYLNAGHN